MSKMKKIVSLALVAMMMVGFFLPATAKAAEAAPTTDVVVHKLKLNSVEGWPKDPNNDGTYTGADGATKYDGSKLNDLAGYFGAGAEELNDVKFSYWKVADEATFKELQAAPGSFDTVEKVKAKLNAAPVAEIKTAGGQGVTVTGLADGYYWFVEHKDSLLADGKTLSEAAAVPFGLQLPVFKSNGDRFGTGADALHVYPKNTVADKPKTDKVFGDQAVNLDDPTRDKGKKDVFVGQEVPYLVQTQIPAKANYQTAKWSDAMTEGLTLKQDSIVVTIGGQPATADDYDLVTTERGFDLTLKAAGLNKVNLKDNPVDVKITYTATVNDKAIVDIPESNDVTFRYGNNPTKGNTPQPTKPENGRITVKKTFVGGDFPEGMSVTVTLYNAQTGERVGAPVQLNAATPNHTFEGLDNDIEYKVVETYLPEYEAEYGTENGGVITIKNHKNPNPEPQRPSSPKVVTGGHRFQKVDAQSKEGLKDAKFVVKNADNKFLAKKTGAQTAIEAAEYQAAEKAYTDAVKAGQPSEELKKVRDAAYVAANIEWKWVDTQGEAVEFVSGQDGFFKVTGLPYGEYKLVETKAPEGYAAITTPISFTVSANSAAAATKIDAKTVNDANLTVVDNKKITIPQTGGRGTILFTIVGIAIMGTAVVAMKRRNAR